MSDRRTMVSLSRHELLQAQIGIGLRIRALESLLARMGSPEGDHILTRSLDEARAAKAALDAA